VRVDAVGVAEEYDVVVVLRELALKELLRPRREASPRVRETLRRRILRAIVEHRVRILELIAEPRDLEPDVAATADEHVWPCPRVLDEHLDASAAQAVEPARTEAGELEPDGSASSVGDALPAQNLH